MNIPRVDERSEIHRKSNSIAWLAHRLASLHDAQDRKVYDAVVVLTDRRVLDQQLQETIYQFEHKTGVVEKIDTNSAQLADALAAGVPIIISTIHKFGFIQDKIEHLPDRRYALIVDETHSSQSREMAVTVKELLSDNSIAPKLQAEGEDLSAPDQLALRAALFRGPQPNMSFFAFTATPKHKTPDFDAQDLVDGVTDQLAANAALQQAAKVKDKGNFAVPFGEALDDALVNRHEKHGDFINKVFQDQALGDFFRAWMLDQVYGQLSAEGRVGGGR